MSKAPARPCPVCGSDRGRLFAESNVDPARLDRFAFASRKLPEYMHHRLLECPRCDLVYTHELPDVEALAEAYREAAYDSDEEARYASRTYAALAEAAARRMPDRRGALDIGTGNGSFLEELLARGFTDVAGVEPSRAPIAAARAAIRPHIRHGAFDPADFAASSFRLVSCFQTLEHVPDPLRLCRDVARLLKPGGVFLFVVHNRRSLSARLLGRRSPIYDVEHLQLFSKRSARALADHAGLATSEMRALLNRYPIAYWAKLFPLPGASKRAALAVLRATGIGSIPLALPAGNLAVTACREAEPGAA